MSPAQVAELLGRARALHGPANTLSPGTPLRGKYLALMCEDDELETAVLFRNAAMELGARVATIRSNLTVHSRSDEVEHTARVLGRLYDAIECQGMAAAVVSAIAHSAGIPVYDGLASDHHAITGLAALLGIDAPPARQRVLLLQAALLGSIV